MSRDVRAVILEALTLERLNDVLAAIATPHPDRAITLSPEDRAVLIQLREAVLKALTGAGPDVGGALQAVRDAFESVKLLTRDLNRAEDALTRKRLGGGWSE